MFCSNLPLERHLLCKLLYYVFNIIPTKLIGFSFCSFPLATMGVSLFTLFILSALLHSSIAASFPCSSTSYVDSYSSLPAAPIYPSDYLSSSLLPPISSSNPLTEGHWSEKANLAAYRPPQVPLSANPSVSLLCYYLFLICKWLRLI